MASIETRTRSDGSSAYRVVWRDPDTRRKQVLTFDDHDKATRTKRLLDANGQRLQDAANVLAAIEGDVPTVATVVTDHINELTGVQERTRKDYRRLAAAHISPTLGTLPVTELTKRRVRAWVNQLDTDLSPKTLHNVHALLSAAMVTAVEDGLRADNPCRGIRLPRVGGHETAFLTPGEFAILLKHVPEHYQPFVSFLAATGVRWGEAVVLTVADVDLLAATPTVRISKALKRGTVGHHVGETKTLRSKRTISLPGSLVSQLVPLVAAESDELLFTTEAGTRLHHGNFRARVWLPAIEAATDTGLPEAARLTKQPRIHDLRHSHGSWLVAEGVDLPTVQHRLGHESITTTINTYGHLMPDQLNRAAQAADAALGAINVS